MAIVGGGPAGIATALSLTGRSVLVLEASDYSQYRVGETLPPHSFQGLRRLDAWEAFLADGHLRSPGFCSSWQEARAGHLDLVAHPFGTGWHIDRRRFDQGLAELARARGIDVRTGHRVTGCRRIALRGYELTVVDGGDRELRITAAIVVDASGRSALLARRMGARRQVVDRLVAAYAVLRGACVDRLTRIEAVEAGWWYLAGLPGGLSVAAFFTDADIAHRLALARPERWWAELQRTQHIREALPADVEPAGMPMIRPAQSSMLHPAQGVDWIAVGDAAMACDPLSSQGVSAALASGIEAAPAIEKMLIGVDDGTQRQAEIEARFAGFLRQRRRYYAMVRRWPDAPFWKRRGGDPVNRDRASIGRTAAPAPAEVPARPPEVSGR